MKNKLYSIAVLSALFIPFVAPGDGTCQAFDGSATRGSSFAQAARLNAASFMPILDWDMSDLDARDSQNKPLKNEAALQNLTALFTENLFSLAVVQNLHAIDLIWNELESLSHLFNNLIFNVTLGFYQAVNKAWFPSGKRFVHNVHNLWIVVSDGTFFDRTTAAPSLIKASRQRLILRC